MQYYYDVRNNYDEQQNEHLTFTAEGLFSFPANAI